MSDLLLNVSDLNTYYGVIHALKNISIEVKKGTMVSVIGANGAGKSTFLKTLIGLLKAKTGKIEYNGKDITKLSTHEIVKKYGISLAPERRQLFGPLSVLDNLKLGTYRFSRREREAKIKVNLKRVYELFPVLKERANQKARTLSGGEQQMVTIGRALMADPELLLLDEPSLGLAPFFVQMIFNTLVELRRQGLTIILVEQNARLALKISDYVVVLETGRIALKGPSLELLNDKKLEDAYLGGGQT